MKEWSIEEVAERFEEAAETGRRLPKATVQGYFNVWPAFVRDEWEGFVEKDHEYRPLPPSPQAIDRMLEVMRWIQWLEIEYRHIVWMRAKHYSWHEIGRRIGCNRTTAWRKWKNAMMIVAGNLLGEEIISRRVITNQR